MLIYSKIIKCEAFMQNKTTNKITKRLLWIVFFSLSLYGLTRVYFKITDDFRYSNISYQIPYRSEWAIADLTNEQAQQIKEILNQNYYYIGKGAQSYAFSSEDNRYVLKFFKYKHLKPSFLINLLPNISLFQNLKNNEELKKEIKLKSVFDGYHLAYTRHKEESGLIHIHLNTNTTPSIVTQIEDKMGLKHSIDLDSLAFVLQEKAKTTRTVLTELLRSKNIEGAKLKIRKIFDLYLSEYNKGIYDRDHGVMHNTGFVGDKPIHLDVGKFTEDANIKKLENFKEDLQKVINKFPIWLKNNFPENYTEIMQDINFKVSEITIQN